MRTVLMLAQWYPPCQAWPTAATRARLLADHLPEQGWRPVVLVPDLTEGVCRCGWCTDPSRVRPPDDPETSVHRLPVRRSLLREGARLASHLGHGPAQQPSTPMNGEAVSPGWAARALWLLGDVHSNWARVAEIHATRLLDRGGVDALWTTSAPFAHLQLGRRLARDYDLPWVADLRDPVCTDVTASGVLERAVRARRRAYRKPLLAAAAVTAATGQVAGLDGPWLGREPVLVVPGFDDAAWADARTRARGNPDRFEIVFTGKLYENYRRPDAFLRGMRLAAERIGPEAQGRLRFVYYGRSGGLLRELAEDLGCTDLVEDRGFVSPDAVPVLTASAGALLLLTNEAGDSGVPGGKFFEYLAARRPVLAVPGKDRYVAAALARTRAGRLADDENQVADIVVDWFMRWQVDGDLRFEGDVATLEEFSARSSARRLATLLDQAVAE